MLKNYFPFCFLAISCLIFSKEAILTSPIELEFRETIASVEAKEATELQNLLARYHEELAKGKWKARDIAAYENTIIWSTALVGDYSLKANLVRLLKSISRLPIIVDGYHKAQAEFAKVRSASNATIRQVEKNMQKIDSDPKTIAYSDAAIKHIEFYEKFAREHTLNKSALDKFLKLCADLKANVLTINFDPYRSYNSYRNRVKSTTPAIDLMNLSNKVLDLDDLNFSDPQYDKKRNEYYKKVDLLAPVEHEMEKNLLRLYQESPLPQKGALIADRLFAQKLDGDFGIAVREYYADLADNPHSVAELPRAEVAVKQLQAVKSKLEKATSPTQMISRRDSDGGNMIRSLDYPGDPRIGLEQREVDAHIQLHTFDPVYRDLGAKPQSYRFFGFSDPERVKQAFEAEFHEWIHIMETRLATVGGKDEHTIFPLKVNSDDIYDSLATNQEYQEWRLSPDKNTNLKTTKVISLDLHGSTYSVMVVVCRFPTGCKGGYKFGELVTIVPKSGPDLVRFSRNSKTGKLQYVQPEKYIVAASIRASEPTVNAATTQSNKTTLTRSQAVKQLIMNCLNNTGLLRREKLRPLGI